MHKPLRLPPSCRRYLLAVIFYSVAVLPMQSQSAGSTAPGSTSGDSQQNDPLKRPLPARHQSSKAEKAYKDWLDHDVVYIILPEERDAFKKLTNDAERENFIEQFWLVRNPHPDSGENEYKEEHYRRIAFANERFAAGVPGWKTDRGRIYILHGAPDSIESHPAGGPYMRTAEEGGGETITYPFEVWHYRNLDGVGQNVDIEFVDTCGCGEYHLTIDRGEKDISNHVPGMAPTIAESMGQSAQAARLSGGVETLGPSMFGNNQDKEFERIEQSARVNAPPPLPGRSPRTTVTSVMRSNLLSFDVRVDFIKGDGDTVLTPVTIQVPNRDLTYVLLDGVRYARLDLSGSVTTLTGATVASFDEPLHLRVPLADDRGNNDWGNFLNNVSLYQEGLRLRPGLYRLDVMLRDMNGDKLGIFAHSIRVPELADEDKLAASTLILGDLVSPVPPREIGMGSFVLGSDRVRPKVPPANGEPMTFARGQKINLWMQVYNLTIDNATQKPSATVEYQVDNLASGQPVFKLSQNTEQMSHAGKQITLQQELSANISEPGVYRVTVKINDLLGEQSIAPEAKFAVK